MGGLCSDGVVSPLHSPEEQDDCGEEGSEEQDESEQIKEFLSVDGSDLGRVFHLKNAFQIALVVEVHPEEESQEDTTTHADQKGDGKEAKSLLVAAEIVESLGGGVVIKSGGNKTGFTQRKDRAYPFRHGSMWRDGALYVVEHEGLQDVTALYEVFAQGGEQDIALWGADKDQSFVVNFSGVVEFRIDLNPNQSPDLGGDGEA